MHRDVARYEKDSVKYQEKEKFLVQKEKKLQKAIQTVRITSSNMTKKHVLTPCRIDWRLRKRLL